jgi:hypothetical protein
MSIDSFGVLSTSGAVARRRTGASATPADPDDSGALELALMRRSLAGRADQAERCGCCGRTMLVGERVWEYATGTVRCALCRERERQTPAQSHTVHGPEFGHSIRVIDRRIRD